MFLQSKDHLRLGHEIRPFKYTTWLIFMNYQLSSTKTNALRKSKLSLFRIRSLDLAIVPVM